MSYNIFIIFIGKIIALLSRMFNLGSGSTWPGHVVLSLNPNFINDLLKNSKVKIILVAGTNGKTTTGRIIQTILEKNNKKVFQNSEGANLLNGIASSLIRNSTLSGKINKDFAIFEIDENTLPLILKEVNNPDFIIILNLFRDQLDRYGEVNTIANKWSDSFRKLNDKTVLILNADDPQVAFLGKSRRNALYFGIDTTKNKSDKLQHASDSTYCPNCGEKLTYGSTYFSHLGNWTCEKCHFGHPEKIFSTSPIYPISGTYNLYNINAAVLLAQSLGLTKEQIVSSLKDFRPAFGRQEFLSVNGKKIQIFLSKNPTGLNESLKTISGLNAENLLLILNDRIPDGRDISWIWDVDFEDFSSEFKNITISGDRAFDMGLRFKYAEIKNFQVIENLSDAINFAIDKTPQKETLYILPTYSAMLEVRKILTGKKIL
jgi:UDP-N-acetylmuramyl tripeptide synthase